MKIACEACGAKYTIADDKVRGRKVKIRCKGCGTPIVVDGQNSGGPNISDVETEADAALEPAEATVTWSVNLSDTDSRTMSTEEIVEAYAARVITADAFVWKDGLADWVPLLESELAPLLTSAAPAAPAPAATGSSPFASRPGTATGTPLPGSGLTGGRGALAVFSAPNQGAQASRPAATRASQPDNTQDLFGAIHTAGAEEEVATSAPLIPQAGAPAYDDGKLTGARNENSVLFSLDALKAGFSPSVSPSAAKPVPKAPSKPAQGGSRPQQPSNPDDPFGMGVGNGLGGTGGLLFGADNQALLTAPAPPLPPPPTPAQLASGALPAAAGNNKLVFLVGGVAGVIIIGLLLALVLGKKHDTLPSAENSAPSASAAAVNAEKSAAEEAKQAEAAKPSEASSASAAPSESAAPSQSAAASAKPADKPVAGTQTSAPKKPKEEAVATPAVDAPPFSKASAISALGAAAAGAGSCKKPGGPTGAGKATVTFAPSGRVTTATVAGGSYAGTAVGGCVASAFRRAHVPAFSGSSVTVSKSFQIN